MCFKIMFLCVIYEFYIYLLQVFEDKKKKIYMGNFFERVILIRKISIFFYVLNTILRILFNTGR